MAQLVDESVVVPSLARFKIGYRNKTSQASITEFVPDGESVDAWSELVAMQTFYNAPWTLTTEEFRKAAQRGAQSKCAGYEQSSISEGVENGYPFSQWMGHCPNERESGKAEWSLHKVIRGALTLYSIHHAFRFEPKADQYQKAMDFLGRVTVCDPRTEVHPCPPLVPLHPMSPPADHATGPGA